MNQDKLRKLIHMTLDHQPSARPASVGYTKVSPANDAWYEADQRRRKMGDTLQTILGELSASPTEEASYPKSEVLKIIDMVRERDRARLQRDFTKADILRERLQEEGINPQDTLPTSVPSLVGV